MASLSMVIRVFSRHLGPARRAASASIAVAPASILACRVKLSRADFVLE